MSATFDPVREAVEIVAAAQARLLRPKLDFAGLRDRLVMEAYRRQRRRFEKGGMLAVLCAAEWCTVFINLIDHPHLCKSDNVLERLCIALDRLERGENLTVMQFYKENEEVFKTL